jgi:multicomponent Na+:H+ antiporter subunit D
MTWLLIACVLLPVTTAALTFIVPGDRRVKGFLSVAGMALLVLLSLVLLYAVNTHGVMSNQMGGWQAPMGITLIADLFSAILIVVSALVGLAVAVYSFTDVDEARVNGGFHTFLHMLIAGVVGAFVTGDLFNLYVWFEVMLISSFALLVLGGNKIQLDGAVKYVAINLISTVILLASIGLVYGLTGTLNMADLHQRIPLVDDQGLVSVVAVLFLIAFGIKAAVFPLYFWLPASYHTLPISVSAVFAGLMTKVGVYALIRSFTLIFPDALAEMDQIILVVAIVTMTAGVLGALTQADIRRILSFHVISSIGFMLLGLGLNSTLAMAAAVFYMVHGMLLKTLLFMMAGIVGHLGGSFSLSQLGGLYRDRPGFSLLFLLAILTLAGIPPLSGFWAKVMIIEAGLELSAHLVIALVLLISLITFIPLIRIWSEAFWKSAPGKQSPQQQNQAQQARLAPIPAVALTPVIGLSLILLWIGLQPAMLIDVADRAAQHLLAPQAYVDSVLPPAIDTGQ